MLEKARIWSLPTCPPGISSHVQTEYPMCPFSEIFVLNHSPFRFHRQKFFNDPRWLCSDSKDFNARFRFVFNSKARRLIADWRWNNTSEKSRSYP
jgi:hypothetical protein